MTPLHFAVSSELPNHIKLFLKSLPNVNVNPEDTGGRTPLNYAVMNSSPICIQVTNIIIFEITRLIITSVDKLLEENVS